MDRRCECGCLGDESTTWKTDVWGIFIYIDELKKGMLGTDDDGNLKSRCCQGNNIPDGVWKVTSKVEIVH